MQEKGKRDGSIHIKDTSTAVLCVCVCVGKITLSKWLRGMSPLQNTDSPLSLLPFCICLSSLPGVKGLKISVPFLPSIPPLHILLTTFGKGAENELEASEKGTCGWKREIERGAILIVTWQSYWEPDNDPSASLERCVDEVMAWWWHLEMEGWRWRGRWRANACRLWPLGIETPLFWQGWVERPLKALDSSSDLTTTSP